MKMQNVSFTELTENDIRQAVRCELEAFFSQRQEIKAEDEIGGIELAETITGLKRPTIYGLVSERKIPHSKQGKRLYFSRQELLEWLKQGKRKTQAEINIEAENFRQKEKEAIQSVKTKNRFPKG